MIKSIVPFGLTIKAESNRSMMLSVVCRLRLSGDFRPIYNHNGSNVVILVLHNLIIMSTFTGWHFVTVAFFLPCLIVGENLAQGAVGHVFDFPGIHPDWPSPVTAGVNDRYGSIRRATCRGQNQDYCA